MTKKKRPKIEKLIRIDNAIYILRVSPGLFRSWQDEGRFEVILNRNGKQCITENDLRRLAYSDDKAQASHEAFMRYAQGRIEDEITGQDSAFDDGIRKNIKKYRNYHKMIEKIHSNYGNRVDLTRDETALAAAYALHAKVLNLLNMACLTLEHHYWYASLLLRPIDEAIDLAEYFIIKEGTKVGEKHLKGWFRENKSPPHSTCRKAISEFMGTLLGGKTTDIHEETLSDLYGSKSKSVHPTFNEIMMVLFKPQFRNTETYSSDFDYGQCNNLRELYELSFSFQSSIWSTVQGFLFCFQDRMPLYEKDMEILFSLNKRFEEEADSDAYDFNLITTG